jgi:FtsH-binding integral membrane protein
MAGLGLIRNNAQYKIYHNWEGALTVGLALIIGLFIVNRFFPKNDKAFTWLLYSLFVVHDVGRLVYNAKKSKDLDYDPIKESIHLYLDVINIFFRICFFLHNIEVFETKKEKL